MDFSSQWREFFAECPEIEGGVLFTADGLLISAAKFAPRRVAACAAALALAQPLAASTGRDPLDTLILESAGGYLILLPILDKAVFAALVDKRAKLGMVVLEMKHAVDARFGPGLAGDGVVVPRPPKRNGARATPEID